MEEKALKLLREEFNKEQMLEAWALLNSYNAPKGMEFLTEELTRLRAIRPKQYKDDNVVSTLMEAIEEVTTHKERSYAWWEYQDLDTTSHSDWFDRMYGDK